MFHWCPDETLMLMAAIPFIGHYFRKAHNWYHSKFHHTPHSQETTPQPSPPRFARQYTLLDPDDCEPPHSLDLSPGSRDEIKVMELANVFEEHGFDPNYPALVGYPKDGRVQLLSGTHRHEAAKWSNIKLPVMMLLRSTVEATWGTPEWKKLISDIPVKDLELTEVKEGTDLPGLDERVDLTKDRGE
jgi:ParB/Sulfiredoxin domain